jgi:hypothetical protein
MQLPGTSSNTNTYTGAHELSNRDTDHTNEVSDRNDVHTDKDSNSLPDVCTDTDSYWSPIVYTDTGACTSAYLGANAGPNIHSKWWSCREEVSGH